MTVSLTGFMGSGKSCVGRLLAAKLGWPFTDLDEYIVHKAGMPIARIMEINGESYFRALEAEALRDVVIMDEITGISRVLSLGGGTIMTEATRHLILEHTESFYLRAELSTLMKRLEGQMDTRPLLKQGSIEERLRLRDPIYELAAHTIDTDEKSVESIAAEIASIIKK